MLQSALMGAHVRFSKAASLSAQQTDGGGRDIVVHVVFAAMGGPDVLHHLRVEVGVEVAENANVDAEDREVFVLHLHVLARRAAVLRSRGIETGRRACTGTDVRGAPRRSARPAWRTESCERRRPCCRWVAQVPWCRSAGR